MKLTPEIASSLRYAIQCRDIVSGKTGDFLFSGPTHAAVSPVFDGLQDLFRFMHAHGLESCGLGVRAIPLPSGTRLVAPNEALEGGDLVLWSRIPRDAWSDIVPDSPFVGHTPLATGLCFARRA